MQGRDDGQVRRDQRSLLLARRCKQTPIQPLSKPEFSAVETAGWDWSRCLLRETWFTRTVGPNVVMASGGPYSGNGLVQELPVLASSHVVPGCVHPLY